MAHEHNYKLTAVWTEKLSVASVPPGRRADHLHQQKFHDGAANRNKAGGQELWIAQMKA